jgi:DNA-binding transcriptional regulator YdaS (Cro superfamily)
MSQLAKFLEENRSLYPTNRDFARAVLCSEGRLSQVMNDGKPASSELAIRIHIETKGAVPASALRPDLWSSPAHVPLPKTENKR